MINKSWSWYANLGVDPENDFFINKKVFLVNQAAFFSFLIALFAMLFDFYLQFWVTGMAKLVMVIYFISIPILNYFRKYFAPLNLSLLIISADIFFMDNYLGPSAYSCIFLFTAILASAIFFDIKYKKNFIFQLSIPIIFAVDQFAFQPQSFFGPFAIARKFANGENGQLYFLHYYHIVSGSGHQFEIKSK